MDALLSATPEQIVETPGIGPVLADTIVETLEEDRTRELIERLRGHGLKMEEEGPAPGTEGPLAGKTFVITGTLPNMSREKATEAIEAAGGKVTNSVSKKTDYLVVGADPGGSKFTKAQEIGTEQVDEDAPERAAGGLRAAHTRSHGALWRQRCAAALTSHASLLVAGARDDDRPATPAARRRAAAEVVRALRSVLARARGAGSDFSERDLRGRDAAGGSSRFRGNFEHAPARQVLRARAAPRCSRRPSSSPGAARPRR